MLLDKQESKIAIYLRTAQKNDDAIAIQEEKTRQFAFDCGYKAVTAYTDNGYSGLNLNRPGLTALENDIIRGKVDTVITTNIARIGRNRLLVTDWLRLTSIKGAKIICVDSGIVV